MSKDIASALNSASEITALGIPAGGPIGIVAAVSSIALKAAAAIALAGGDPVKEIARILSSDVGVDTVHGKWEDLIKREFSARTEPAPPPVGRVKSEPPLGPPEFPPPDPSELRTASLPSPPPPPPTIDEDPTPPADRIYDDEG